MPPPPVTPPSLPVASAGPASNARGGGRFALLRETCPSCHASTTRGFCRGCAAEFARVTNPCPGCGLPQPVIDCPQTARLWRVSGVIAPYVYTYPLSHYLQALKFRGDRCLGRAFGLLLAAHLDTCALGDATLVPIPLHRARLRRRGYNQTHEIARTVATELGIPMQSASLRRRSRAGPQSALGRRARQRNMTHAYELVGEIKTATVLLLDDIITTGATINAAAAALLAAGIPQVNVAAVARTLPGAVHQHPPAPRFSCPQRET